MSLSPYVEKKTGHPMVQKIMLRIKFQIWSNYIYADASDHHVWTRLCYIRIHMIVYVHVSGTQICKTCVLIGLPLQSCTIAVKSKVSNSTPYYRKRMSRQPRLCIQLFASAYSVLYDIMELHLGVSKWWTAFLPMVFHQISNEHRQEQIGIDRNRQEQIG